MGDILDKELEKGEYNNKDPSTSTLSCIFQLLKITYIFVI